MQSLILLWILIVIPYTGIFSPDDVKDLCQGIDKKITVNEIVINDRGGQPHFAYQVKCFKVMGDKI